jgi:hypothetical protein
MQTPSPAPQSSYLACGTCLSLMALAPLAVAGAILLAPPAEGPVAAVFPPWIGEGQAFAGASASGLVSRLGALPFVMVVASADRAVLRDAGAWLLLDAGALGLCAAP